MSCEALFARQRVDRCPVLRSHSSHTRPGMGSTGTMRIEIIAGGHASRRYPIFGPVVLLQNPEKRPSMNQRIHAGSRSEVLDMFQAGPPRDARGSRVLQWEEVVMMCRV